MLCELRYGRLDLQRPVQRAVERLHCREIEQAGAAVRYRGCSADSDAVRSMMEVGVPADDQQHQQESDDIG
jgi:hypothetical protein